jgi:hypothetical protein
VNLEEIILTGIRPTGGALKKSIKKYTHTTIQPLSNSILVMSESFSARHVLPALATYKRWRLPQEHLDLGPCHINSHVRDDVCAIHLFERNTHHESFKKQR